MAWPGAKIEDVRWVAVRCCCTPNKVLGFMSLPSEQVREGSRFTIRRETVGPLEAPLTANVAIPFSAAIIEVRRLWQHGSEELAIYSDDRPLEFWREVPGFVEAVGARASR